MRKTGYFKLSTPEVYSTQYRGYHPLPRATRECVNGYPTAHTASRHSRDQGKQISLVIPHAAAETPTKARAAGHLPERRPSVASIHLNTPHSLYMLFGLSLMLPFYIADDLRKTARTKNLDKGLENRNYPQANAHRHTQKLTSQEDIPEGMKDTNDDHHAVYQRLSKYTGGGVFSIYDNINNMDFGMYG